MDPKEIQKTIRANCPPRYKRLEVLERWFDGRQYDALQSWWDDAVPLWERAPCLVYPVVAIAIQSNVDLVLGEGRFPVFSGKGSEDEANEENGTNETDGQALDRFLVEYHKLCQFNSHAREAFTGSQTVGSAVALHGHRKGVPFADLISAKAATPTFTVDGDVESVDIQYPYIEEYKDSNGSWKQRVKMYRRTIDATTDQTFLPANADADGRDPQWIKDPTRTIAHGLGFCPVVWYPFMRGCAPVNVYDGKALHQDQTDEIHQHDIAISQRHRCALFSEPQIYECGVEKGSSPTETGRTAIVPSSEQGGRLAEDGGKAGTKANPLTGGYGTAKPVQARKKGPGYVWQFESPDTKVGAITIPESALKFQDDNARDILHKIENALGVVLPKPEDFKFASSVSGKSIEMMKQRQLDRCDQYRDDLRDNFLIPSVNMQLRIAAKLGSNLKVPGSEKIAGILKALQEKATTTADNSASPWAAPSLSVKYGPYFKADVDDQKKVIEACRVAMGGGTAGGDPMVPRENIMKMLAPIFGIENVAAAMKTLDEERDEKSQRAVENAQKLASVAPKPDPNAPPDEKTTPFQKTP